MEGAGVLKVLYTQCIALQIIKCYLALREQYGNIEIKTNVKNEQRKCVLTHYLLIDVFVHHPHIHIKIYVCVQEILKSNIISSNT
jgi:hypothetical protein